MINKIKKLFIIFLTFNIKLYRSILIGVAPSVEHMNFFKDLKDLNTLIDIGSNKGQFGLISRYFFPDIYIHSFEPQNFEIKKQKKILGLKNINYYNFALGSINQNKTLMITKRRDSSSLLQPNITKGIYDIEESIDIEVKRIDQIIDFSKLQKPILTKLDIQGYELEALKGFGKLLKEIDYILVEVSFQEIYKNQPIADEIVNFLEKENFFIIKKNIATKFKKKIFQQDFLFERKK